jgi:hypothetical protein
MEYKGGSCITRWLWSGGTLDMSGDTRTLSIDIDLAVVDVTDGQASNRSFLPATTEWAVNWQGVAQNNASAPAGTLYALALQPGTSGTLLISPYGTATGDLFYIGSGFSNGLTMTAPYADVVSLSASWRFTDIDGGGIEISSYGAFIVGLGIVGTSYIGA